MADVMSIGKRVVELCNQQKYMEAIDELYASNIVSIEAGSGPEMPAKMEGIDAIRGKSKWWIENHTVHSAAATGPFPHGDRFVVFFKMDVTPKSGPMNGRRFQMEEAALYEVKNGKIVKEEFFYSMG